MFNEKLKATLALRGIPCISVEQSKGKDIVQFHSELDAEIFQGILDSIQLQFNHEGKKHEMDQYKYSMTDKSVELEEGTVQKLTDHIKGMAFSKLVKLEEAAEVALRGESMHSDWGLSVEYKDRFKVTKQLLSPKEEKTSPKLTKFREEQYWANKVKNKSQSPSASPVHQRRTSTT